MKRMYDLEPIYDSRKSFYNKAIVTEDSTLWDNDTLLRADGEKHLYSYNTEVCYIDAENKVHLLPSWNCSVTTLRHIKEFLRQEGFKADSKAQIEKDYLN